MKPTKVAAVVAGSMMALGAASPAFAIDPTLTPSSLNGGVDSLGKRGLTEAVPTDAVGKVTDGKAVGKVKDTAGGLEPAKDTAQPLLGGLPALGGK
ncbi:hypothetical protein E2C00_14135 [Streptomyces sp. WAC05374]|uniref:hypothetical protein n=1 Tax=Streptomyces sp. WAC05374 TaxID=2487420 RepID=UPI000F8891DE|nr:hypothetical protein [Streptomyces sp. WAC05374]RST00677.1 hypothetical protein EF905_35580 [Streptomyces sp. WAC05374]TDF40096.1 hypothetical protein E2B92_26355 [Streptomyces sp. WAC05374]TDF56102.1 hypothetical protein E2C00_14135 [Streptomyces sp. WAC05374]TDF59726.1 hypothetical protein E2C02_03330 [Streptomyces sp. WAC05374]